MAGPLSMSESRSYPVAPDAAFDRLLSMPLPLLFSKWYGPIPPVRRTEPDENWGVPGQKRTIVFGDGGRALEALVSVDRPREFSYRITGPTGPFALLISEVAGTWSLTPAGKGVRISWAWEVSPRSKATSAALPVFAHMWRHYARGALARLEHLLLDDGETLG